MIPTVSYLEERFDTFNAMCFEGALPRIPIKLSKARCFVGRLQYRFGQKDIPVYNSEYTDSVMMEVLIEAQELDSLKRDLTAVRKVARRTELEFRLRLRRRRRGRHLLHGGVGEGDMVFRH